MTTRMSVCEYIALDIDGTIVDASCKERIIDAERCWKFCPHCGGAIKWYDKEPTNDPTH